MSDFSALPKSCPKCGADLPSEATEGLCPRCILSQAMQSAGSKGPWLPPTAQELAALLPQYEIECLLGRGGMGAVYKGRQINLDRPVAIKILPLEMDDRDSSYAERFKNEARAMAKLSHPGIVAVYDFGQTQSGLLYFVMEFIEGTDVARMIAKQGRLHTEHAMAITAHVCDALAYAHSLGILHRDIKPANIMVGYDGRVKVADFGLAKMTQSGESALTQSGVVMGTLHYMAPESLILGTSVDQRADIYAVGVMLYQMLTGKVPHGMFELPSLQVPGIDPRYDSIIAKAMREDRDIRYQNAAEMRFDLDHILTRPVVKVEAAAEEAPVALPTEARPQRPAGQPYRPPQRNAPLSAPKQKSSSGLILAGLAVLAVLIGGFFLFSGKGGTTTQPVRATKDQPFVNTLGMKFVPVPDTKVLFSVWDIRVQDYTAYARANDVNDEWLKQTKQTKDGVVRVSLEPEYPVVGVSWNEAQAFCQWLAEKEISEGKLAKGSKYRLPTDEEWSRALGLPEEQGTTPAEKNGKNKLDFPWGTDYPPKSKVANYGDMVFHEKFPKAGEGWMDGYVDGYVTTAPVGSFPPNALGLYDMGGNVQHWCEDWFDASQKNRVTRGASWTISNRNMLLSSARGQDGPGMHSCQHGFRIVLEVSDAAAPSVAAAATEKPLDPQLARATKDAPFANTLGMKFVPVPGTKVLFCIHETRRQDYAAYAAQALGVNVEWKNQNNSGIPVGDKGDHPVVAVSWDDAQAFCLWLTERERSSGKLGTNELYRLPSDHEWSCAVGIGDREDPAKLPQEKSLKIADVFPWGTDYPPPDTKGGNYADSAYHEKFSTGPWLEDYTDGFSTTAPVMSFKPNRLGLYDLGGNVWEWCEDWLNADKTGRVRRGGSWYSNVRHILFSSVRDSMAPVSRHDYLGFRIVLEVSAPAVAPAPAAATDKPLDPQLSRATKDQPFANTLGMKFVPVPDTKVLFCIHETRRQDYAAFDAGVTGVDGTWKNRQMEGVPYGDQDDHPVSSVSWEDAQKFCEWLSKKDGLHYRLPTDREWSCAVGIESEEKWTADMTPEMRHEAVQVECPWSGRFPPKTGDMAGNYADSTYREKFPTQPFIEGYSDGFPTTAPVMSFKPNQLGIYDLGGNVWEWCEDWFNAKQGGRVLRGGAWYEHEQTMLLSSSRRPATPGNRDRRGFRVVIEISATAGLQAAIPGLKLTAH